jgi:tripartite-type tricarboxylate transporter receptor subunit TctC
MYRRSLIGSAAAAGLLPGAARAQPFPSKQLRLLVGFAAGGGGDIVARILAQELTKSGGLSVMVDNKPGAGGNIATREMLRAPADGHTVLLANVGILAVNPYAMKDAGYDPQADIAPVCLAVDFSNVLVVHPSVPATTLAEYLALARRPDGMDYGTAGVGTAGHLAGELLRARSGARLNHVPFRGGGPAMNDLMGGHVPSLIASAPTATGFMREGKAEESGHLQRRVRDRPGQLAPAGDVRGTNESGERLKPPSPRANIFRPGPHFSRPRRNP